MGVSLILYPAPAGESFTYNVPLTVAVLPLAVGTGTVVGDVFPVTREGCRPVITAAGNQTDGYCHNNNNTTYNQTFF